MEYESRIDKIKDLPKRLPKLETADDCIHIWKCMQTNPKKYDSKEHKDFYKNKVIPLYRELTGRDLPTFSFDKKGS